MMKRRIAILLAVLLLGCVPAQASINALPDVEAQETENVAIENDEGVYRVYVRDAEDNPVEGVMIQFCDESTCAFQPTDPEGVAVFEVDAQKVYEVHVLKAPEVFEADAQVYHTLETFSDVTIVLEKLK